MEYWSAGSLAGVLDHWRCRFCIIVAEHYRDDDSCKCDDPLEQEMMIREWGYDEDDFRIK